MLFRKREWEKAVRERSFSSFSPMWTKWAQNNFFPLFSYCDISFSAAAFGFSLTDNKDKTIQLSVSDTGMSFYGFPMIFPLSVTFFTLSFNAFELDLLRVSEARCCGNWNLGQNSKFSWALEGKRVFSAEASSQRLFSGLRYYSEMSLVFREKTII